MVEANRHRGKRAPSRKATDSIEINSIIIDLGADDDMKNEFKCNHFSLRGYVAERRETHGDTHLFGAPYSPLIVRQFNWWNCEICVKAYLKRHRGNDVEENRAVNLERQIASTSRQNTPESVKPYNFRSKGRKPAITEQVSNKKSKAKADKSATGINIRRERQNVDQAAVTAPVSPDIIAGVVEDRAPPPKAIKNHKGGRTVVESDNVSSESLDPEMSRLQRSKTRKIRLISDLLGNGNAETSGGGNNIISTEESAPKRGRKRKLLPENDQGDGVSTDSGFERDPFKGKKKKVRFQIAEDFAPSLPCETSQEFIREKEAYPGKSALSAPVHSLSNGKDSVPCTPRSEKRLGLAKEKSKKPVAENAKSSLISFMTGMAEGNQVQPQNGPSQTTRDFMSKKRSLFDDGLASAGYIRKSNLQLSNKPAISLQLQDNDHMRGRDVAAANNLRCIGSSSKSNAGGWLRSTGVDAVNLSSNNKTNPSSFPNLKLGLTPSSTDVARALQKDASGADRKGKTIMVQEAPRSQGQDRKENTPEEMEIVELMAKNQYERCLPDKEEDVSKKQPSQETADKPKKKALMIDLNEAYDNENDMSLEDNNTSPPPCDSNARKQDHFPLGKQQQQQHKSLEFLPVSQPYLPSIFATFPPTQEIPARNVPSVPTHQNGQWLRSVPVMATTQNPPPCWVQGCNTCHTSVGPQYREPPCSIWPSSVSVLRPQGHQRPASFLMHPPVNNPNFIAVNANTNEKQKCGGGFNGGRSSMDMYANESSIPAMHLLSLKSHTPTGHQGSTKFTKRHFPPVSHQANERLRLQTADSSKPTYPTNQLLPFKFGTQLAPVGTSSLSFQNAQASWIQPQEKRQDTFVPPVYSSQEKSVFPSSGNNQGRLQFLGTSESTRLPLRTQTAGKEKKQKKKAESSNNNASALPVPGTEPMVCVVNRNPADFTIPEPGNIYMLSGESLVPKSAASKRKTSLSKQDAVKRTKKRVCPATEKA